MNQPNLVSDNEAVSAGFDGNPPEQKTAQVRIVSSHSRQPFLYIWCVASSSEPLTRLFKLLPQG